jgi:hypothetical protein
MYEETTPVEQEKSVAEIKLLVVLKSLIHLPTGEEFGIEAVGK